MTDDEMAHHRAKPGDPSMPLSIAQKMQREESKWRHLRKAATPTEPCRYRDGTCLTHSGRPTG